MGDWKIDGKVEAITLNIECDTTAMKTGHCMVTCLL